jgi:hypothetical protein
MTHYPLTPLRIAAILLCCGASAAHASKLLTVPAIPALNLETGEKYSGKFVLKNTGTEPVSVSSLSIKAPYTLEGVSQCIGKLAPGLQCEVPFTITSTNSGTYSAALQVQSDSTNSIPTLTSTFSKKSVTVSQLNAPIFDNNATGTLEYIARNTSKFLRKLTLTSTTPSGITTKLSGCNVIDNTVSVNPGQVCTLSITIGDPLPGVNKISTFNFSQQGEGINEATAIAGKYTVNKAKVAKFIAEATSCGALNHAMPFNCNITIKNVGDISGKPEVKNLWIKNGTNNFQKTNIINNCSTISPNNTCTVAISGVDSSTINNWTMSADIISSDASISPYNYGLVFKVPTYSVQQGVAIPVPYGEVKSIQHTFNNTSDVPLTLSVVNNYARVGANTFTSTNNCSVVAPKSSCTITDTIDRSSKNPNERTMDTYYSISQQLKVNYGENNSAALSTSYSLTGQLSKEVLPASFISNTAAMGTTNVYASPYSITVGIQNKGTPATINGITLPSSLGNAISLDTNSSCKVGSSLSSTCLLTVKINPDALLSKVGSTISEKIAIKYANDKLLDIPLTGRVEAAALQQEQVLVVEDAKAITTDLKLKVLPVPVGIQVQGISSDPEGSTPHAFLSVAADTSISKYLQGTSLVKSITSKPGMKQGVHKAYLIVQQKGMTGSAKQTVPFDVQVVESIVPKGTATLKCESAFTSDTNIACEYQAKNTGKVAWAMPQASTIRVDSQTSTVLSDIKTTCGTALVAPNDTCTMQFKINASKGLFIGKSIPVSMGDTYNRAETTATLVDRGLSLIIGATTLKAQIGEKVESVFFVKNSNSLTVPLKLASRLKANNWMTLSGGTCGTTLAPGAQCTIPVVCAPTAAGMQQNALSIQDLPDLVGTEIGISCEGLAPKATITSQNTTNKQIVGENTQSGTWHTITNVGVGTVKINTLGVSADKSPWILYTEKTGTYCYPDKVLNPSESCNVLTRLMSHNNSGNYTESFYVNTTAGALTFTDSLSSVPLTSAASPIKGSTGESGSATITLQGSALYNIKGITVSEDSGKTVVIPSTCEALAKGAACQFSYTANIGATSETKVLTIKANTPAIINGIPTNGAATTSVISKVNVPVTVVPPAIEVLVGKYDPISEGRSAYAVHLIKNNGDKAVLVSGITLSQGSIHRQVSTTCYGTISPKSMCAITTEAIGNLTLPNNAKLEATIAGKAYSMMLNAKVLPEYALSARATTSSVKIEPGKNGQFTYYVYNESDKSANVAINVNTTPIGATIAKVSALSCTSNQGSCSGLQSQGNTLKGLLAPRQVLTLTQEVSAGGAEGSITGEVVVDPIDAFDKNMADNKANATTKVGLYEGDLYVYVQGSNNLYNTSTTQKFTYLMANMGAQTSQAKFKLGISSSKGLVYNVGSVQCTRMDVANTCPNGKSPTGEYVISLQPNEVMEISTMIAMPAVTDDVVVYGEITPISFKDPTMSNNVYRNQFKVVNPMLDLSVQANNTPSLKYIGDTAEIQYYVSSTANFEAQDALFTITKSKGLSIESMQCIPLVKNAKCYTPTTTSEKFWINFPEVGSSAIIVAKVKATTEGSQSISIEGAPDSNGPGKSRAAADTSTSNNKVINNFTILKR